MEGKSDLPSTNYNVNGPKQLKEGNLYRDSSFK